MVWGTTKENFDEGLKHELSSRLGNSIEKIHIGKVFYDDLLQPNEERYWNKVGSDVRFGFLREWLLFGFADAAGLETYKDQNNSVYWQAQVKIAVALLEAKRAIEDNGSVVFLAQSLGCQLISCYFWDANNENPRYGIWSDFETARTQITRDELKDNDISFLRGATLKSLITTGCNIPIFVAAHDEKSIVPFNTTSNFTWYNFYDKDDVLGWPLEKLSDTYGKLVKDHQINSGGGLIGSIFTSWNPFSHLQYWSDKKVLDPLEKVLRTLSSR